MRGDDGSEAPQSLEENKAHMYRNEKATQVKSGHVVKAKEDYR
jgi:hypothetical protein